MVPEYPDTPDDVADGMDIFDTDRFGEAGPGPCTVEVQLLHEEDSTDISVIYDYDNGSFSELRNESTGKTGGLSDRCVLDFLAWVTKEFPPPDSDPPDFAAIRAKDWNLGYLYGGLIEGEIYAITYYERHEDQMVIVGEIIESEHGPRVKERMNKAYLLSSSFIELIKWLRENLSHVDIGPINITYNTDI